MVSPPCLAPWRWRAGNACGYRSIEDFFFFFNLSDGVCGLGMNIAALNHALQNIPGEQLRMHLCRGNPPGPCASTPGHRADLENAQSAPRPGLTIGRNGH